jgi:predicted aspartyl protease
MEGVVINGKQIKATIDTGADGMFALTPAGAQG